MKYANINSLIGSRAAEGCFPVHYSENSKIHLNGTYKPEQNTLVRRTLDIDGSVLQKGVLLVGEARIGKTTVIKEMIAQTIAGKRPSDKLVILDVKREYWDAFGSCKGSIAIGPKTKMRWNIFRDILAFGNSKDSIEIYSGIVAEYMFADQKSAKDPFFTNAARLFFQSVLIYFIRQAFEKNDDAELNNKSLMDFLKSLTNKKISDVLDNYRDFSYLKDLICDHEGECTSEQCRGVKSELDVMLGRFFIGSFAKNGDFSVVELMKSKGGFNLFLLSDQSMNQMVDPILRYFLDMMFGTLGSPNTQPTGEITFVLDEYATLPHLNKMAQALALLKYRCSFISGLQSVQQVFTQYSESEANTILAMHQTIILMRSDDKSVKTIADRLGNVTVEIEYTLPDGCIGSKIEERPAITQQEVNRFDNGDAVIKLPFTDAFRFHFDDYSINGISRGL